MPKKWTMESWTSYSPCYQRSSVANGKWTMGYNAWYPPSSVATSLKSCGQRLITSNCTKKHTNAHNYNIRLLTAMTKLLDLLEVGINKNN